MIKLVVFDWNGTLLADSHATAIAANKQLEKLGRPLITLQFLREHFEIPLTKIWVKLGISNAELKANHQEIATVFHSFYEPLAARARTRQGTRILLEYLHKNSIRSVVLSNHTMEGIYLQLDRLKLSHFFDTVLANDNISTAYFNGKEPRLHDYLLANRYKTSETVIIGDTTEEVAIGRNLGLITVAITDGYNSNKRLKAAKPDFLIHKLTDLMPILDQL